VAGSSKPPVDAWALACRIRGGDQLLFKDDGPEHITVSYLVLDPALDHVLPRCACSRGERPAGPGARRASEHPTTRVGDLSCAEDPASRNGRSDRCGAAPINFCCVEVINWTTCPSN
jgi:hypothetical protein